MNDPTNNQPDERPEWANRIIMALVEVDLWGRVDDRLTEAERDLLATVIMRLQHRLGEPPATSIGYDVLADFTLDRAIKALRPQDGQQ